jgi:hypothetical protein
VEKVICKVTDSAYAHAAIGMELEGKYRIIHATRPAVHTSEGSHFDDYTTKEIISFPITAEQRQAVADKALELLGKEYGIDDCIEGGIKDIADDIEDFISDNILSLVHGILEDPETFNCSSTQIELVRAAFPNFAEGINSCKVTPEQARLLIIEFYNQITQEVY